ncbi:hypothetical protein FisN_5Lh109 [Fistulifera solaris]|uniref:SAP domain-containing protein n=1 Tax=Fistulifera solaris TaxID=1519565 RepID=A0A1Z5JJ05_FISSO|nr:hypothetical protein FisN_5Lh109 [Fistulifera solaris]|eukprot:GAX13979.1 hypothetical protein FisN_5Lh109 [Fistulifera solaris]
MKDSRRALPRVLIAFFGATLIGISRAYLPSHNYKVYRIHLFTRQDVFSLHSSNNQIQSSREAEDEETLRALLNQQQQQLNLLLDLLQKQKQGESPIATRDSPTPTTYSPPSTSLALAPCKVMLFIDGTWLYYSLHERSERDCPLIKKYGRGWQHRYMIDWEALPRIICEKLQDPGWRTTSDNQSDFRSLEVVRANVFTSYKADTSPLSWRYQMFEDMKAANYDVHMMQTVGRGEKCVDIQLAVEMLHFATVPHAYDIALLLTGDKDFMPAMIRTRQKGRKVGLVSLRKGCNRALYETAGVKDFDVCWMEDFIDEWVKPRNFQSEKRSLYSTPFFVRILVDFIAHSNLPQVSSRDLGRYLKFLELPGSDTQTSVLKELKSLYGGLSQFLASQNEVFTTHYRKQGTFKEDSSDNSYFVSLNPDADTDAQPPFWSGPEQEFFRQYTTDILEKQRLKAYHHSLMVNQSSLGNVESQPHEKTSKLPEDLIRDYSVLTVNDLKARCRERNLPVSGVKAQLLERIKQDNEEQIARLVKEKRRDPFSAPRSPSLTLSPDYLHDLVFEYVKARGGKATSRDVGRYLAANRGSKSRFGAYVEGLTALQELKDRYGSLLSFVAIQPDLIATKAEETEDHSFFITLKKR